VTHNDCRRQPLVLSKWRHLGAPQFDCPPKRLVWIRHCCSVHMCRRCQTGNCVFMFWRPGL